MTKWLLHLHVTERNWYLNLKKNPPLITHFQMPFLNLPFHTCILPGYKGLILVYSPSLWRWQKVIIKTHNHLTGSMDLSWGMTHDSTTNRRFEENKIKPGREQEHNSSFNSTFSALLVDPQSHISYICMYTYFHIYKCLHAFMSMFLFSNKKIHPPGVKHIYIYIYNVPMYP